MRDIAEYPVWWMMKQRCENPNGRWYHRYGGRGIVVCERWQDFENFIADMGRRPSPSHTIERINNDGNYCPENCCWADRTRQARNRRSNRMICIDGERKTLAEWAESSGIQATTIAFRISKGWKESELLIPVSHLKRSDR
jgi:hypothetical protein